MSRTPRRFVTGHDQSGKSVFLSDSEPPQYHNHAGRESRCVEFYEIWNTDSMPAIIRSTEPREPNDQSLRLPPPPNGTIVRILDIHPGHTGKLPPRPDGKHPGVHRTETIDYGVLIEGELHLLLDDSEVSMLPGDVTIQRGTIHAWENRSNSVARIAFILIDGKFSDELRKKLNNATIQDAPLGHTKQ
jgi:hypothetical protein